MKPILVQFVNVQTGESFAAYIDAEQVLLWHAWNVPDDLPQGWHRRMRGKTVTVFTTKCGTMHWTEESFEEVSAKILEALALDPEEAQLRLGTAAAAHKDLAEGAKLQHKSHLAI